MNKILLFGGSFDPIHNGHLALVNIAYQSLNIDECYFIIAKNPRWKDPTTTPNQRLEMLQKALSPYPYFKISLIEYNSEEEVNYTFDTINKLGNFENNKYYYLIGADQLDLLDKWYNIDKLSKMVQFVCYKRLNHQINEINLKKYNCILLDNELFDISSTMIRNLEKLDTPKVVIDYIIDNNLYFMKKVKRLYSEKRFIHALSVANLAYDIALANKVDENKAFIAGLLHDISKILSIEQSEELINSRFKEVPSKVGKWAYHQFTGSYLAQVMFDVKDIDIINSIKYHSTGRENMSKLEKIIYCADKLDPTRGWDSSTLIEECKKDIDQAFIQVLIDNIKYFRANNVNYSNEYTLKCFKYYLKEGDY